MSVDNSNFNSLYLDPVDFITAVPFITRIELHLGYNRVIWFCSSFFFFYPHLIQEIIIPSPWQEL